MKHLVLLVLICSMTGLPVNAVDSPTTIRLFLSAEEDKMLMQAYLKRELRKLDGFKLVEDAPYRNSTWEIVVISITMRDGFYVAGMTIIRNRYMKPYLKPELNSFLKERMETISEYHKSSVHTGSDMQELCSRIIVLAEEIIRG